MENLDGPQLFDTMYAEDTEGQKLNTIPGTEDLLNGYKDKFSAICHQIFEHGLARHKERMLEVKMFWECVDEAKSENKDLAAAHINTFMEYKKQVCSIEIFAIVFLHFLCNKCSDQNQSSCGAVWKPSLPHFHLCFADLG